ncbi:MAG: long-chain fatty acid--CoA ligase [Spirochaetaceae bacterium]|nr:MAG: long-chain fatty acid--CoA ligase [Spirochaetaceae bacterium]
MRGETAVSRPADAEFASHDSISDAVLASLAHWGNHPALSVISPDRPELVISAVDLRTGVLDVERLLRSWGVRQSVPVALFLENSSDFVILLLALARIGAVVIPSKLDWHRMELEELFANADPQLVISEESHLGVISPFLTGRAVAAHRARGITLVQEADKPPAEAEVPDNVASINYTYRGLGYPLGAMVTHRQYLHGARVLQDGLQAEAGEQMLYSIPMTHIFTLVGCILVPLLYGLTGVIARTIHPRLLFQAIDRLNIQHLTAVPEIYSLLLRAHGASAAPPSLRTFVSGGSVLSGELFARLGDHFGVEVLHGYGLTEFTPVSRNARGESQAGTVGPICDGIDCRIMPVDHAGSGEIMIRSRFISPGYYRRETETRAAWDGEWFRTGDTGRFSVPTDGAASSDGFTERHLMFDGERKATRKVNGVMVDLEEVRLAMMRFAGIRDASVSFEAGVLTAEVAPSASDASPDLPAALRLFLKEQIASYKIPRIINLRD